MISQKIVQQELKRKGGVRFGHITFGYSVSPQELAKYKKARGTLTEEEKEIEYKLMDECEKELHKLAREFRPFESNIDKIVKILKKQVEWYKKWKPLFPSFTGQSETEKMIRDLENFEYWPNDEGVLF